MPDSTNTKETEAIPTPPAGVTPQSETKCIQDARATGERGKIAIARAYANIVTYQFYRYYECLTVEEYFDKVLKGEPSIASVREWAAVAENFTEDQAAEFTCHRLAHVLTYAKRKGIEDLSNPGEILIDIPDGDQVVAKSLRDCSTIDIERALARLSKPRGELPPGLDDGARRLQMGLASFLGTESYVRVNIARRGRSAVIQIDNLQAAEAERLLARLQPS